MGPYCKQDRWVFQFHTTTHGNSFYMWKGGLGLLIEEKPFIFQELSKDHKTILRQYIDQKREGNFIQDPFPYPFYDNRLCSIAKDLDKPHNNEVTQQPVIGKLRITKRDGNLVSYQSHDRTCKSGLKYTGYLHENGWAVHEKKKSGEQIQTPFAFVQGLTIYVDPNLDKKFDYKTKFDSSDAFCKILEDISN